MIPRFLVEWKNITVTVTEKRYNRCRTIENNKVILNNISGFATNNSLIAIMGPSGSGKTTFLGAVSGKIKDRRGEVKFNNRVISDKDMWDISCYIHQEDVFTETMTVYEHMKFMAALKLHNNGEERNRIIKKVLIDLCLEEDQHTIIRILSGGQRRRLSLATELISDPSILFCDEPTTGLDSFSAMTVVKLLEAAAASGKLVLVTLHQPSSQIFDLFNNIILLANGKLIFQGSKLQTKLFFESANFFCPVSYNPADFYIKCITRNSEIEESYADNTMLSDVFHGNFQPTEDFSGRYTSSRFFKQKMNRKNFLVQLKWLTWRVFIDFRRSFFRYKTSYLCLTITALMLAISYSNVDVRSPSSAQNIQGALSLIISELVFTHMYYVIYIFPEEIVIFAKDKLLYSAFPYYVSKILSLIPLCVINALSFMLIYTATLQFLQNVYLFFNISFVLFLTSFSGISLGLCLSALFPSVDYIHLFVVPLEIIVMTLSGIWIKIDTLPQVLAIIKYCSPFYYGFQSISVVFWRNMDFVDQNRTNSTNQEVLSSYSNGEQVLRQYGFYKEYDVVFYNTLYLIILTLVYCFVGYLGILRKRAVFELH